jgi:hypothetical protein
MTITDETATRSAGRGQHRPARRRYALGDAVRIICPESATCGQQGRIVGVINAALPNTHRYLVQVAGVAAEHIYGPAQLAPVKKV